MFVNILRIASSLEFSLPSFLPSRKRSLFSSFKKTVFSDIEFSNFFSFLKLNKVSLIPPSKRIILSTIQQRSFSNSPFFWHISIQIFTL